MNIAGGKKILKNYLKAERNGSTFMDCRQRYALYNDRKKKAGKYTKTDIIGICSRLRIERIQIFHGGEGLWRICKAIRKKIKVNMMGKNVLMV